MASLGHKEPFFGAPEARPAALAGSECRIKYEFKLTTISSNLDQLQGYSETLQLFSMGFTIKSCKLFE